jgi:hypothetical protein
LTDALAAARRGRGPMFVPSLERPFSSMVTMLSNRRGTAIGAGATLLRVFLPYIVWNTVFDNTRVTEETGRKPAPFSTYCYPLLKFSSETRFSYPYREWPAQPVLRADGIAAQGAAEGRRAGVSDKVAFT